jgi:hypothetical protein
MLYSDLVIPPDAYEGEWSGFCSDVSKRMRNATLNGEHLADPQVMRRSATTVTIEKPEAYCDFLHQR